MCYAPATIVRPTPLQTMRIAGERWTRDEPLLPADRLQKWICIPAADAVLSAAWHTGATCARWRIVTPYESASGSIELDAPARAVDVLPRAMDACRALLKTQGEANMSP